MAVAVVFFTNAALYANVVPRLPDLKAELGLSNGALGSAIAAFPLGALSAGLLAGTLVRRLGSAQVAALGLVALAAAVALLPVAPAWGALAAVLLVAGAVDAVVDVAQNAHGLRVQRRYGRSIVNSFHGWWSVGSVVGGLMGAGAAGLGLSLGTHLATSSALFALVAVAAWRFLLPGPEDAEREPAPARPSRGGRRSVPAPVARALLALGAVAACGALVEDAAASWGALYLLDERGTSTMVAGLAFVTFGVAMTAGRLLGDRVVDRVGAEALARGGGALAAAGMGLAVAVPSLASTLLGFGAAGLGVATIVPAAMHTADELPGLRPGFGLTVVSWLLRVGFLVSAPVVGAVADATSLRVGLLGVVVAGLVVVVVGRAVGAADRLAPIPPARPVGR